MSKAVLFQTIQFSIQKHFHFKQFTLAYVHSVNVEIVLFHAIQLSIHIQFSSIRPIDRTLSGATPTSRSGSGSDGNEEYFVFARTPALLESDHHTLASYQHSLWEWSYPSVVKKTVYSTAPADWANFYSKG